MAADWATDVVAGVERWIAVEGGAGRTLLDGLGAAGPAPLAQALARKQLAGPPTSRAEEEGLVGAQLEAFRACLSPGIRLVWAPPGTGSATVLARAVAALADEGKRVLLVSPTDTAIDEALDAAVRRMSAEPGVVVRVGPTRLGEDVQLERLAARASREADAERAAVAAELREIEEIDAEIERLHAELGDHDDPAYRAAARVAAEQALAELRPRLPGAEAAADVARRAAVTAATELREALDARSALEPVREALEHERLAVAGLAALERRQRALQEDRATLDAQEPSDGWRARRQRRRQVDAADVELLRYTAAAAEGRRRWLDVQLRARTVIGEHGRSDLDEVDLRAVDAEAALAAADGEYRRARELLIGLRGAIDEAEAADRPTDDDRRLVADGDARGLAARHGRLRELAGRRDAGAPRRGELDARHRELVDRAATLRAEAEAQIAAEARVVATTLDRSRVHPVLAQAEFDAVLVDGAGAAALAEVLLALCRATTTAVLIGDFLQPGPVVPDDPSPALRQWVRATCFSHLGIESPGDVDAHDGCVALTHQIGFGAALRRLTNGVSPPAEPPDRPSPLPDVRAGMV